MTTPGPQPALVQGGGTGATVQLDFLFDGETELVTLIEAFPCSGSEEHLEALLAGTPYLRVVHPDDQSSRVRVSVTIPPPE